jgi:glycosyltransferase involved in cell wall biosynthesis
MRIAFYAPMKAPDAPTPSGDRRMARLLMEALRIGGHEVELASRFRSWSADPAGHAALREMSDAETARLLRGYAAAGEDIETRPELWFTYHLYYKAPDWIGPAVADALGIPYIVAEASHAPKRAAGPWAASHAAAEAAIRRASAICAINPADSACLAPLLDDVTRLQALPPFLDTAPFAGPSTGPFTVDGASAVAALRRETGFSGAFPIALTVAMMRPGDKRESYRVLAAALRQAVDDGRRIDLAIIGGGNAQPDIVDDFAGLPEGSVCFLGARPGAELPGLLAGGDLYLWPAIREAYGMAMLEAQAAGLPVIAGDSGGVSAIVRQGETGLLAPEGDVSAFAAAISALARDAERRQKMGRAAVERVARDHTLASAAGQLNVIINDVIQRRVA